MKRLKDIIYLCSCALNDVQPQADLVAQMDLQACFLLASQQGIAPTVYQAVKDLPDIDIEPWKIAFFKNLKTAMLMDMEAAEICEFMESNKIWYTPLKGMVVKDFYPVQGMRQMADFDILFDEVAEPQLDKFMLQRGYQVEKDHRHNDYKKLPCYHFEMHRHLITDKDAPELFAYYQRKQLQFNEDGLKRSLLPEDFYIFQTCHYYKHNQVTGSGLRPLMDAYVFLRANKLDEAYVQAEFEKVGIADFEKKARSLALKLFGTKTSSLSTATLISTDAGSTSPAVASKSSAVASTSMLAGPTPQESKCQKAPASPEPECQAGFPQLDEDEVKWLENAMGNGAYGSMDFLLDRTLDKVFDGEKAWYKYLFPSLEHMHEKGLTYAKHKALLPVYWVAFNYRRLKTYGFETFKKSFGKRKQSKHKEN